MDHRTRGFQEFRLPDVVARFFSLDDAENVGAQLFIRLAGAHAAVEIVFHLREQAGANFAVGGESNATACAAKWPTARCDYARFPAPVGKAVTAAIFPRLARGELNERKDAVNGLDDLSEGDDDLGRPAAVFFE